MATDPPFAQLMTNLRQGDAAAAQYVFRRYAHRLIGLAATRLPQWISSKIDPEDVVQSALRSFFLRQAAGQINLDDWDGLWTMLTVITVRKCGHRLEQLQAARRDARREVSLDGSRAAEAGAWKAAAPTPTPAEAILLAETIDGLMKALRATDRPILALRLQGYTAAEISEQVGRSERTVERVLRAVREQLSCLRSATDHAS